MITLLIAAAAPAQISADQARFEACVSLADSDPARALDMSGDWRIHGGGVLARHCAGLAYVAQSRWAAAAVSFEQAARQAETQGDARAANLWVQAGNAALAGGNAGQARQFFDAALARNELGGQEAGELSLDRARASVALADQPSARRDLDSALKLVPADPLAWLLSATLARKMNDLPRARADIAEAASRSPDDASVALEAGNIAMLSNAPDAARIAWEAAIRLAPNSPAGKAAAVALAAN